ncbi:MAG: B3/B4 domain-containing protein [Promethearchaeota archaeon]
MNKYLEIHRDLQSRFPGLAAQIVDFIDIHVEREKPELEEFKKEIAEKTKTNWKVEELREDPTFRAYRDFFWKLGIDPTKIRPAAEALIRRVLRDRPIPKINTWVDAYNLVSMETAIPIASFDTDLLSGEIVMREAIQGEEFLGIAMKKPVVLKGGEAILEDNERLVAIYPYRDADYSKVTMKTRNVLLLMCGAPGITLKMLNDGASHAGEILPRFCGGRVG